MANFDIQHIKNIVLVGHTGSGKTTLAEAMAYNAGFLSRRGTVEEKNTLADYTDLEQEKGKSFFSKLIATQWEGYKINVLDTPGNDDFSGEIISAMRVADCGVMLLNAVTGVEVGTDIIWEYTDNYKLPMLLAVNQIDHESADFDATVQEAIQHFGRKVVIVQYPIRSGNSFDAVIDVLHMKLYRYSDTDGTLEIEEIPEIHLEKANQLHQELVEAIAGYDETLMERFFEQGSLTEVEMKEGLHQALIHHELFPVFCLSGLKNRGVNRLMEFIDHVCPSAYEMPNEITINGKAISCNENEPAAIYIYKTLTEPHVGDLSFFKVLSGKIRVGDELTNENTGQVERIHQIFEMVANKRNSVNEMVAGDIGATLKLKNTHTHNTLHVKGYPVELPPIPYPESVLTRAIESTLKGEEEKLSQALHQLIEEDPTLRIEVSSELKQTLIHCQGELHLSVIRWKLEQSAKLHVQFVAPKIPYRETIRKSAETVYRHKKQTGGAGQFAEIAMKIEPWYDGIDDPKGYPIRSLETVDLPWGGKLMYYNCIVGGAIDTRFHASILKGIMEKMHEGPLTGSYVRDIRVLVFDGKMHSVDSNDLAFKTAGMMAFKTCFYQADPLVLEPYYHILIHTPETLTGTLMSAIQTHRGVVEGMDSEGHFTKIQALVPCEAMDDLGKEIRALSQGRARFTLETGGYQPLPLEIQKQLVNNQVHEIAEV